MNQSSNSNQYLDPDDSVHHSVTETSFDFSNQKPKTEQLLQELTENDDSVDQLETETSFEFSNLQIDANCKHETEQLLPESPETDDSVDQSAAETSFDFSNLHIDTNKKPKTKQMIPESPENDDFVDQSEANDDSESQQMTSASLEPEDEDEEEDDEDEEGEFTFMYVGDNDSYNTELFESGQIRFPLFDQSLLSTGDNRLPITVPVDNVFIESPRRSNGETDGISTGTFCAISKDSESGTPEINIKSNSTGFSKLWRFRDNMNRSNSDGRDAFVFFQSPTSSSSNGKVNGVSQVNGEKDGATSSSSNGKVNGVKVVDGKVKGNGKVTEKVVKKGKKKVKSAHEVYLKQKGGKTEDERRRSYLPYRPGLMGFFTNVNGGLSKNVHPF